MEVTTLPKSVRKLVAGSHLKSMFSKSHPVMFLFQYDDLVFLSFTFITGLYGAQYIIQRSVMSNNPLISNQNRMGVLPPFQRIYVSVPLWKFMDLIDFFLHTSLSNFFFQLIERNSHSFLCNCPIFSTALTLKKATLFFTPKYFCHGVFCV